MRDYKEFDNNFEKVGHYAGIAIISTITLISLVCFVLTAYNLLTNY